MIHFRSVRHCQLGEGTNGRQSPFVNERRPSRIRTLALSPIFEKEDQTHLSKYFPMFIVLVRR